jgi:hypothetical protein
MGSGWLVTCGLWSSSGCVCACVCACVCECVCVCEVFIHIKDSVGTMFV